MDVTQAKFQIKCNYLTVPTLETILSSKGSDFKTRKENRITFFA